MVQVSHVRLEPKAQGQRLVGRVDGREIHYAFPPSARVQPRGEPFLLVALLTAMLRGEPLAFDASAPLDPKLIATLPHVQAIYSLWSRRLREVEIHIEARAPSPSADGTMTSFSGGVDGACTVADHFDEIDALLFLNCFDSNIAAEADAVRSKFEAVAKALSKDAVFVSTNVREAGEALGITWAYAHGPVPCLLAGALGVRRFYMPSSYTYADLKPWGSHPVLDPLWSTTTTEVVHDGGWRRRTQKLRVLAQEPALLKNLQVCYASQVHNCGSCPKCVRTTIALWALKIEGAPFPSFDIDRQIGRLKIEHDLNSSFVRDLADLLQDAGQARLARRLRSMLRRFRRKRALLRFRAHLLEPRVARQIRRWAGRSRPASDRLWLEDPDDSPG